MSMVRSLLAAAVLAGFFVPAAAHHAAAEQYLGSYIARISPRDKVASDGYPLGNAAQVVRQDRANVHRFRRADREDQLDPWFRTNAQRARLQSLLERPGAMTQGTRRAILHGHPLIGVDVYRSRVRVRVLN